MRELWAKLNRGAKIGSIVGIIGILPFGTYAALGFGSLAERSVSAASFFAWGLATLAFAVVWLGLLSGGAVIGGALGTFVWKLVGPLPENVDF